MYSITGLPQLATAGRPKKHVHLVDGELYFAVTNSYHAKTLLKN